MAFHCGRPVDATENPDQGGSLGVAFHKSGDSWYSVAHNSVSIFTLDRSKANRHSAPQLGDPVFHEESSQTDPVVEGANTDALSGSTSSSETASDDASAKLPLIYWEEHSHGNVPADAVRVGKDKDGGMLYVGRAYIFGCLIPGKVAEKHRVCYVALEGREYALGTYEVLVVKRGRVKWVPSNDGQLPPNAIPAGFNLQGDTIYSAKAVCSNIDTPGHFIPGEGKCCISYNLEEKNFAKFDVLTIQAK